MQLGRAIIGGIIGAAIGIGVLIAAYLAFGLDKVWLSLPVAILTGLGVRTMVATGGHASYLRGAITGGLALGAYLLGWFIVAQIATKGATSAAQARLDLPPAAQAADDADEADDEEKDEEEPAAKAPAARPSARPAGGAAAGRKAPMPKGSTMDIVWLCVSTLIAYELGRGTAAKAVTVAEETVTEVPDSKHPDA